MSPTVPKVYYNNDPKSFAFATCHTRWPILIQGTINDVAQSITQSQHTDFIKQGQQIHSQLISLKNDVQNDADITCFNEPSIPGLQSYDETILEMGVVPTWSTAPWLFSECYLYRKINVFFVKQTLWCNYDVFNRLKQETFKSSSFGVCELATRYRHLHHELNSMKPDLDILFLFFQEFADISLWGNATDLSLLANATLEDIKSVQGAKARKESEKNILTNDISQAWTALIQSKSSSKRVDFVLDNSGFELYADLILVLFLLDSRVVDNVVLHGKDIPWMVSDVMIKDFQILIDDLQDPNFFPDDTKHQEDLKFLANALTKYVELGKITLQAHPFWTLDLDYTHISPTETRFGGGCEVHKELTKSDLVIFKGDLNYRKLSGDRMWPRTTPFNVGIGSLASSGIKVLSLRTCKADVCLGLEQGKDEELCKEWEAQGNEVGQLWCSSGKWAVMSFCNGDYCLSD